MKKATIKANEIIALIKSGKSPEEAVRIANSHDGNFDAVEKQISNERKGEQEKNEEINAFSGEVIALIKSGKSPEEAVRISNSHSGNYQKVKEEIEEEKNGLNL